MITDALLKKFPIISDQVDIRELRVLLGELEYVLANGGIGNVVEFGCYAGTTSLFIRRLLDAYKSVALFHVYDSFVGLPEKSAKDASAAGEQFRPGELAICKKDFLLNFKKANLQVPRIHKGWFSELLPTDVPENIMFAFLDGDYYESIRDSLQLIIPRLAPGAVVVVDDYVNEALPGAARAVDEWRKSHACKLRVQASLAIIMVE